MTTWPSKPSTVLTKLSLSTGMTGKGKEAASDHLSRLLSESASIPGDFLARAVQAHGDVGGAGRFADAAFAVHEGDDEPVGHSGLSSEHPESYARFGTLSIKDRNFYVKAPILPSLDHPTAGVFSGLLFLSSSPSG